MTLKVNPGGRDQRALVMALVIASDSYQHTAVLEAVMEPSVAEDTALCMERFTQWDRSLFILAFQVQENTFKGDA